MRPRIHVYCNIVDNYGDIGIAYRLARNLARKDQYDVTLWFSKDPPEIFIFSDIPTNLTLRTLYPDTIGVVGELAVTTFSSYLPKQLRALGKLHLDLGYMSLDLRKSQYFSVTGRHSFHPGYIDGFVLGAPPALPHRDYNKIRMSWFTYKEGIPERLRQELENYPSKIILFSHQLEDYQKGSLQVSKVPFLPHKSFDWLLSTCDVNFVRGEDSFVRSQLTRAITVWQPYDKEHQQVTARLQENFTSRYTKGWPEELATQYEAFVNSPEKAPITHLLDNLQVLRPHCLAWRDYLLGLGDISDVIHKQIKKAINL